MRTTQCVFDFKCSMCVRDASFCDFAPPDVFSFCGRTAPDCPCQKLEFVPSIHLRFSLPRREHLRFLLPHLSASTLFIHSHLLLFSQKLSLASHGQGHFDLWSMWPGFFICSCRRLRHNGTWHTRSVLLLFSKVTCLFSLLLISF